MEAQHLGAFNIIISKKSIIRTTLTLASTHRKIKYKIIQNINTIIKIEHSYQNEEINNIMI